MTELQKLQDIVKSVDAAAEWIDENCMFDNSPWMIWWDKEYCDKCESVILKVEETEKSLNINPDHQAECAYCEVYGECRYFPEIVDLPDTKHIIKLWLTSEAK